MADQTEDPAVMTEEERIAYEERQASRSWQSGQQGGTISHTLGGEGGAGAAASGPDIAEGSAPTPGNSSDEPSR
jgi:hypothetical protein